MRVLTTVPQADLTEVPDAARRVEADGYDAIVTMENRHDPFLPLAVAATATERVELVTGIAIAFARSPMSVANMSWDLQGASRGRFVLGLGSQVKGHNVRRFSVPWSPPAPRMREYIEGLRAIWRCWKTGEKLDYRGEHYQFTLMTPNFTPEPIEAPMPAVTIGAVGPAMMKVAAEVCDGVRLHPFCTRRYMEEMVVPKLEQGLAKTGRSREQFEITGGGFIATGPDDEAVDKMVEWVRMRIGFYGSTPAYFPVLELHGLEDLGHKLNRMSKEGQWEQMTAEIPDDVVRMFAAIGKHDEIAAEIERHFGGVSDAIFASVATTMPADYPPGLIQDIQRIKTRFSEYSVAA
ncbi:MAG: TIGR03617 family F420-dependent LLM class oxidoreductase [Minwuiales bacterium]|nr:TIGR03617 family F420-dependent LLM class oxidoreductase [Minwuiales bacterium]